MRKGSNFSQKLNNILYFLAGILVVVIVGVVFLTVQSRTKGNESQEKDYLSPETGSSQNESRKEKWQEGTITYQGKNYKYNSNLSVFLLMGIDSDDPVEEAKDSVSGGQSDALFLLIADSEQKQLSIVSINRNTMTQIDTYDANGTSLGKMNAQICLQHGYGDGKKLSCSRTVDAVEYLFYNLPISGYMAINMGAIGQITDSVGGVEVEVLQDIKADGVNLVKGQTVNLSGQESYYYLRKRDTDEFGSATDRLRREEQFLSAFITKIQTQSNGDTSTAIDIYNSSKDYLVTDVDFTNLVSTLMQYDYSEDRMYTVPGETVMGDRYEEYQVDKDAFYDLIIKLFYKETD